MVGSVQGAALNASILAIGWLLSACASDADVSTVVRRLPTSREATLVRRAVTDQSSAVTIESMKIPIVQIALSRGDGLYGSDTPWVLYTCSGATDADCLVDLASNGTNQLAPGEMKSSLPPGTYTSMLVSTCKDKTALSDNKFKLNIQARAIVGGESLFTKTGSPLLSTVESSYSPIELTFSNCRNYYVLNKPLVIEGGEEMTFAIYNDLRANTAVYRFASNMSILEGIVCSANGKPYICIHPPNFFVITDGKVPVVERYRLRNTSAPDEAHKVIGLAFNSGGEPLGGYVRGYLDGTQDPTSYVSFPGELKRLSASAKGLSFTDFWADTTSNNFATIAELGNFTVPAFPRPEVGAGQVAVSYTNRLGVAQTAPTFTVERID